MALHHPEIFHLQIETEQAHYLRHLKVRKGSTGLRYSDCYLQLLEQPLIPSLYHFGSRCLNDTCASWRRIAFEVVGRHLLGEGILSARQ